MHSTSGSGRKQGFRPRCRWRPRRARRKRSSRWWRFDCLAWAWRQAGSKQAKLVAQPRFVSNHLVGHGRRISVKVELIARACHARARWPETLERQPHLDGCRCRKAYQASTISVRAPLARHTISAPRRASRKRAGPSVSTSGYSPLTNWR